MYIFEVIWGPKGETPAVDRMLEKFFERYGIRPFVGVQSTTPAARDLRIQIAVQLHKPEATNWRTPIVVLKDITNTVVWAAPQPTLTQLQEPLEMLLATGKP